MVCWKRLLKRGKNTFLLSSFYTSNKTGALTRYSKCAFLIWKRSCVKCQPAACHGVSCGAGRHGPGTALERCVCGITRSVLSLNRCRVITTCTCPVCVYLSKDYQLRHSVDVDFPFLQTSAEEHGSCHQEVVGHAVSVDVHRRDLTAVIRTNLEKTGHTVVNVFMW